MLGTRRVQTRPACYVTNRLKLTEPLWTSGSTEGACKTLLATTSLSMASNAMHRWIVTPVFRSLLDAAIRRAHFSGEFNRETRFEPGLFLFVVFPDD